MSWARFFEMGGYAVFVWGSFGMALGLMCAEVLILRRRRKRLRLMRAKAAPKMNVWKENETTT